LFVALHSSEFFLTHQFDGHLANAAVSEQSEQ